MPPVQDVDFLLDDDFDLTDFCRFFESFFANEAYEQYQVTLNTHNRLLGRLSEMLGCGCKLTSYTSRHSWATASRNLNVPISVIIQGMGHTSEQTTQIYLTMLENSVIDDANKGKIGGLE